MKTLVVPILYLLLTSTARLTAQGGGFGPEMVLTNQADGVAEVVAADIDGDGDLDVVAAAYLDHTITWFENLGGFFGPPMIVSSSVQYVYSLKVGDIDGDGDLDVLSASFGNYDLGWQPNLGGGVFGPRQVITSSAIGTLAFVDLADLDGDGDLDIALGRQFFGPGLQLTGAISWIENQGGGTFGPLLAIDSAIPNDGVAMDADEDGDLDVVWLSSQALEWSEHQGGGTFAPSQTLVAGPFASRRLRPVDFDGDGDEDLALFGSGAIAFAEHTGAGTWGLAAADVAFLGVFDIDFGDLDDDGDLDVAGIGIPTLTWIPAFDDFQLGPRVLVDATVGAGAGIDLADLDGDGRLDLLYADREVDTVAWRSNRLSIAPHPLVATELEHSNERLGTALVAPGDLNGDGRTDLITGSPRAMGRHGRIRAWSPAGQQELWVRDGVGDHDELGARLTSLGDVNGDGVGDVAAAFPDDQLFQGRVEVISGATGNLLFSHQGITSGDHFGGAIAGGGDWDGDGVMDYAVGARSHDFLGSSSGYVRVFAGGSGTLLATLYGLTTNEEFGRGLAFVPDRDGDGKDELLVGHRLMGQGEGALLILQGGTGLTLGSVVLPGVGLDFGTVMTSGGDTNGDGISEILVANPHHGAGAGKVWLLDGATLAVLRTHVGSASEELGASLVFAGDLSGNGGCDYLLGAPGFVSASGLLVGRIIPVNGATGTALDGALQMQGAGAENFEGGAQTGFGRSLAALGDQDGDGFAEFTAGLPLRSRVWVFEGLNPVALYSDCAQGNAGQDLLFLDGAAGGAPRRVTYSVGEAFTLLMDAPASNGASASFAVAGFLGVPTVPQQTPLP
ncbi:MAG TPA: VCBS repeat-containing protein, partial [Planctomycetes bacterium]|nr:VCBS repeat-containing protein [Planctomycetota bacterium]